MSINNGFSINYSHLYIDVESGCIEEAASSIVIEEKLTEQIKDSLLSVQSDLTIEGHINRLLEQLDMKMQLSDQLIELEDRRDELEEEVDNYNKQIEKLTVNTNSIEEIQNISLIQHQEREIQIVRIALKKCESKLGQLGIEKVEENIRAYTAIMESQENALVNTINAEIGCDVLNWEDLPLLLSYDGFFSYLTSGEDRLEKIAHAKK